MTEFEQCPSCGSDTDQGIFTCEDCGCSLCESCETEPYLCEGCVDARSDKEDPNI